MGALKVAAIPPAAPQATKFRTRSSERWSTCPTVEPKADPRFLPNSPRLGRIRCLHKRLTRSLRQIEYAASVRSKPGPRRRAPGRHKPIKDDAGKALSFLLRAWAGARGVQFYGNYAPRILNHLCGHDRGGQWQQLCLGSIAKHQFRHAAGQQSGGQRHPGVCTFGLQPMKCSPPLGLEPTHEFGARGWFPDVTKGTPKKYNRRRQLVVLYLYIKNK